MQPSPSGVIRAPHGGSCQPPASSRAAGRPVENVDWGAHTFQVWETHEILAPEPFRGRHSSRPTLVVTKDESGAPRVSVMGRGGR